MTQQLDLFGYVNDSASHVHEAKKKNVKNETRSYLANCLNERIHNELLLSSRDFVKE